MVYKEAKILDVQPTRDFRLVNFLPVLPEIIPREVCCVLDGGKVSR